LKKKTLSIVIELCNQAKFTCKII